jgi:hypothetical protein
MMNYKTSADTVDKYVHHDMVVAYLEGKTVQHRIGPGHKWTDLPSYLLIECMPHFDMMCEYRLKPIDKPNVTKRVMIDTKLIGAAGRMDITVREPEHWETADLELVFDGNTNRLVSANVLR